MEKKLYMIEYDANNKYNKKGSFFVEGAKEKDKVIEDMLDKVEYEKYSYIGYREVKNNNPYGETIVVLGKREITLDEHKETFKKLLFTTYGQRTIMIQSGVFNDFIETYVRVVCKNLGYDENKAVAELSYLFDTFTYDELKSKLVP
ncbi:MAG: hypothetical protein Q4Q31_11420 [Bacillota bacterium]|nr:hypothetical protein [Bacillota bacterium]